MTAANHDDRLHAGREATGRRLRAQIGIFSAVFVVITALAVVRVVQDGIAPRWPLAGFAVGLVIGVILGRSKALGWDATAHRVVSSLTIGGASVTVAYQAFLVLRDRIVGTVVHDSTTVAVVGLAITGGVMLGRLLVMVRDIRRILTKAGVLGQAR